MYKRIIEEINELQEKRLKPIKLQNKRLLLDKVIPTNDSGFYWIYTSYSIKEINNCSPCSKPKSVIISEIATQHYQLNNVCKIEIDGFLLVYNGIGGKIKNGGLRERVLQEFRGGNGTGSLSIKNCSINDLLKWRISYVLWSEINSLSNFDYNKDAEKIERLWRIHYGWPILCNR